MALGWRSRAFIALSVMGIAVAVYHAYGELTYSLNSCSLSDVLSCNSVFGHGYDTFPPGNGISFWVYGVVWFPLCLLVGFWAINRYGRPLGSVVAPFLMVGNIFTAYPWYIEIVFLHGHYCPVCVSLYIINYLLTFIALTQRSGNAEDEETGGGQAPPPEQ